MKKYFLFLLLLVVAQLVRAEDSLMVYQLKGQVSIAGKKAALKTGNKVAASAQLVLAKNSSVTMICPSYYTFSITTAGTHALNKLADQCNKTTSSVSRQYFEYVWEQFTHPHASPESQHRHYMQNAGGVSRGCPGIDNEMPDTINYTGGKLTLNWKTSVSPGSILLYVRRNDPGPAETEATSRMVAVDSGKIPLSQLKKAWKLGQSYSWAIGVKNNEACESKIINYIDPLQFKKKEAALKKLIVKSNPAEEAFMMGFLLSAARYYDAATAWYEKAVKLAPGEKRYSAALNTHRAVFQL